MNLTEPMRKALAEAYELNTSGLHLTDRGWADAFSKSDAFHSSETIDELVELKLLTFWGADKRLAFITLDGMKAAEALR